MNISRGVGVCLGENCEDYHKSIFLLNPGSMFICPRCRKTGRMVPERVTRKNEYAIVKEVRVEFNYDPVQDRFREVAIIRDDAIWGNHLNVFTIFSPLIKTDKRALKVGEAILANLRQTEVLPDDGEVIRQSYNYTMDLSWDKPMWKSYLKKFQHRVELLGRDPCEKEKENT